MDHLEPAPLLGRTSEEEELPISEHRFPSRVARRLYISHFLSTWNSRVFEFGAVLYLATVYPGTLLPMSTYAFTRGLAAVVFAPAIGQYVDKGNRLTVVRFSIIFQRLAVAISCGVFYLLTRQLPLDRTAKRFMFVLLTIMACVEKLCSIMNAVAVERDWVVVIAEKDQAKLTILNAQMRRIDLFCKILGPLFIALLAGYATEVAILINLAMNVASVFIEYVAIANVYHEVPDLQVPKGTAQEEHNAIAPFSEGHRTSGNRCDPFQALMRRFISDFSFYAHHRAFLPSFSDSLLYLTVLSFGGQMVTYLLAAGYSSSEVGIARTVGVVFEMLSTWVAPWLMTRVGPVRAGLWMSTWQSTTLTAGIVVFWAFGDVKPAIAANGLVFATILSRIGLRGFDLCTEVIVQDEVEEENRGVFSSVEAACQNGFELFSFASTIIFFRPEHFKWPTLISVTAVLTACLTYSAFVYLRRGHLVHMDALRKVFYCKDT